MISILKNKKGFTLIELLLVVAIIAILSSVAYPRFVDLKRTANTAKIAGDLQIIDAAINQYYLEHRAYPLNVTNLSRSVLVTSRKYFISVPKPPSGEFYVSDTVGGVGKIDRARNGEYAIIAPETAEDVVRRAALHTGVFAQLSTAEYFSDFESLSNEYNF